MGKRLPVVALASVLLVALATLLLGADFRPVQNGSRSVILPLTALQAVICHAHTMSVVTDQLASLT